ncbi:hypothetical protein LBMAG38_00350 [Chloroflexota bacterium]|nr:hypothetical protein LBMAG38_00350 [Chloroflexota bacterium]
MGVRRAVSDLGNCRTVNSGSALPLEATGMTGGRIVNVPGPAVDPEDDAGAGDATTGKGPVTVGAAC